MYEHIIVPFDGTEEAGEAAMLAAELGPRLGGRPTLVTSVDADAAEVEELKARAVIASDSSVDVWVEKSSRTASALASAVHFRPGSLVCLASHARDGVDRLLHGSLAGRVVAEIDAPVLVLGPEYEPFAVKDLRGLIVCVDGSETGQSVVPLAARWASHLELPVLLVTVDDGTPGPDLDALAELLRPHCPDVGVRRIAGAVVADAIVSLVAAFTPCIVVMGSHGRSGLGRLIGGSQIDAVVRRSPAPVLVQRAARH